MASAAPTKLSSRHWRMLIDRIHDGRCIPFLGAGVNAATDDYQGLPLGNEVTLRLIEKIVGRRVSNLQDLIEIKVDPILSEYEGLVPDNPLQLSWVADYFRQAHDSTYLLEVIQDILADRDREPSPLLETLAGIPFNLVVTCNYDKLMERALEKAGVPYQVVIQPPRGFDYESAEQIREALQQWNRCILYKLHGDFMDYGDQPRDFLQYSIVLTEDDYIDFMRTLSSDERGIPRPIRAKLAASTLLFLGYSLQDWDWRMVYGVTPLHERQRAISIQKDPPLHWVRYWERKEVMIYNIDLRDFAEELSSRYAAHRQA
jgi:hypothetical protein